MLILFIISGFVGYMTGSESAQNIFQKYIPTNKPETLPDEQHPPPLSIDFPRILDDNLVDVHTVSSEYVRVEKPLPMLELTPYKKDSDDVPFFWSGLDSGMIEVILTVCLNLVSAGSGGEIDEGHLTDKVCVITLLLSMT
jgi:hypothetical protein